MNRNDSTIESRKFDYETESYDDYKNIEQVEQAKINRLLLDWVKDVQKKLEKFDNRMKKAENIARKISKEAEEQKYDKIRTMEMVGIFVAIFTFISVEIQILKQAESIWLLFGLSTSMFAGMALFFLTIIQIAEKWIRGDIHYKIYKQGFIWGAIIILVIGSLFLYFGNYFRNSNIKKYKTETEQLSRELKGINSEIKLFELKIQKLDKNICNTN